MLKRILCAFVLLGLAIAATGCGEAQSVTPKATPEMEAAQKKEQESADEGERAMQNNASKASKESKETKDSKEGKESKDKK